MTLIGNKPSNNLGRVLHFSNWVWQPLVEYLEKNHYDAIKTFPDLRFNAGEVSDFDAKQLANQLSVEHAEQWSNELSSYLNSLPLGPCFGCFGFGTRRDGILGSTEDECVVCKGAGQSRQYVTQYYFLNGHIYHLREFLKSCGGFSLT